MRKISLCFSLVTLVAITSSCAERESSTIHFMKWETQTRHKYTLDDISRYSKGGQYLSKKNNDDIYNLISGLSPVDSCELNYLDIRMAISVGSEFLIASDYFCVCKIQSGDCFENTEDFRSSVFRIVTRNSS